MFSICDDAYRREIVDTETLEGRSSNWKLRLTGAVLGTLSKAEGVYCLSLTTYNVQIAIRWWNVSDLGLIFTTVGYLSDQLLLHEVIYMNYVLLSLEHNDVIVVPTFLVNNKASSEGMDVAVMGVVRLKDALHLGLWPWMLAEGDMGVVMAVLIIVN